MVVSAAVVFLVVYQDTGVQLKSEIDRDISGDTSQLLQSLAAVERSATGADSPRRRRITCSPSHTTRPRPCCSC